LAVPAWWVLGSGELALASGAPACTALACTALASEVQVSADYRAAECLAGVFRACQGPACPPKVQGSQALKLLVVEAVGYQAEWARASVARQKKEQVLVEQASVDEVSKESA
jgi:hypothetical protein